jgi:transcription-repair coupling factor (superfamily II helicase)
MVDVGYDMYLKLLEEAVLEARGEKPEVRADCSADLAVSATYSRKYMYRLPSKGWIFIGG